MSKADSPRGPEEVRRALIDACERLCAVRPPSSVSVRDVATEAHVTSGLVHHYFESKDQLLAMTASSIAMDIDAAARDALADGGDSTDMVRDVWRFLGGRPAFRSIVLWWVSEGRDVTSLMGDHPLVRTLAATLAPTPGATTLTRTGVVVTLLLAGHLVPGVNRALGRDTDDEALAGAMEALLVRIARPPTPESDNETNATSDIGPE